MDARDIINARRRAQLADNSDRFPALSSVLDNVEYQKDFKPTNIQKYDDKQDPAQWLRLYTTAVSVAGGDTNTKVLYLLNDQTRQVQVALKHVGWKEMLMRGL